MPSRIIEDPTSITVEQEFFPDRHTEISRDSLIANAAVYASQTGISRFTTRWGVAPSSQNVKVEGNTVILTLLR